MKNRSLIASSYKVFSIKYFLSFILLALTQLIFWLVNRSYFSTGNESVWMILLGNIVFILSTLSVYLCLFILLSTLPVVSLKFFRYGSVYHKLTSFVWLIPTFLMVLLNLVDVFWYPTMGSRSNLSQFMVFLGIESKFSFVFSIIKTYIIPIGVLLFVFYLLIRFCRRIDRAFYKSKVEECYRFSWYSVIVQTVLFLLIVSGSVLFYRGYYKRCLRPIHAAFFSSLKNTDLVLNTPYILFRTYAKKRTVRINFFSQDRVNELFNIERTFPTQTNHLNPVLKCVKDSGVKNIVILQIESLGAEYFNTYNPESHYTPFLDSLIKKSVSWKGWANGNHTMAAPLSVNSSFPQYDMDRYFLKSERSNTVMDSLSQILHDKGYDTSIFFPDENGSMYLDVYAKQAGFNSYYGKNEYDEDNPGNGDFPEGSLGVLDEPFLKFSAKKIDETYRKNHKPFYSYIITTTSHYPYVIPDKYKKIFPPGTLSIHQSIQYVDNALRQFFDLVSDKEWSSSTLFIVVADHTSESRGGVWKTSRGQHMIPIIFHIPGSGCSGTVPMLVSQVDIFPTILDLLEIESKIMAYGRSIFDPAHENMGLASGSLSHMFMLDNYFVECFERCQRIEVFDTLKDPLHQNNLMNHIDTLPELQKKMILNVVDRAKASIQLYNNRFLDRKVRVQER